MALAKFLDSYDIILFDMDGVITSEQNYWNTAALTVYEFLVGKKYMGKKNLDIAFLMKNYKKIRKEIFCDDKIIVTLKNKGVNSNWDLAYVTVCINLILGCPGSNKVLEFAKTLGDNILEEYNRLAEQVSIKCGLDLKYCLRNGELWGTLVRLFQEWYLGDSLKPGLIHEEIPIIPVSDLKKIISELKKEGKSLGYGTGRMAYEVEAPLSDWDIIDAFDKNRRISYDNVTQEEKCLRKKRIDTALTKPHPYMFLKGAFGEKYPIENILNNEYDKKFMKRVLVVGDAGADILAAKASGAHFCCVLTGINGAKARPFFEVLGSEHILNSIKDFIV